MRRTKIYPLVLVIWSILLFTYHSYHSHRTVSLQQEALTTIRVVVVGNVILATFAYLLPLRQLSRSWFVLFGALAASLLVFEKIIVRVLARYVRAKGLNYRTVLIVGTGRRAIEIARLVADHNYWGYKILGFVSDGHRLPNGWARYRTFGTVPDLKKILEHGQIAEPIDEIVFAVTRKSSHLRRRRRTRRSSRSSGSWTSQCPSSYSSSPCPRSRSPRSRSS